MIVVAFFRNMLLKAAVSAALVVAACIPAVTDAQTAGQPIPSYARPSDDAVISGRISAITGKYDIEVRDDRGYIDHVALHDGTIINPTGLQLAVGMSVRILGYNRGEVFAANEIDTPYASYPGYVVAPAYPAYPYPYPAYFGFGYAPFFGYGPYWGPRAGVTIGWGGYYGGWYGARGGYGHGYYGGYGHGYYGGGYGHGYYGGGYGRGYYGGGYGHGYSGGGYAHGYSGGGYGRGH
jgi:hypothetical protein